MRVVIITTDLSISIYLLASRRVASRGFLPIFPHPVPHESALMALALILSSFAFGTSVANLR